MLQGPSYPASVGVQNYLVEGLSGTGKTTVAEELQRRGFQVVHGDRELAYQGDPQSGEPLGGASHEHHIWSVRRVRELAGNRDEALTFFCGGSRNFRAFIDLFDGVFVLQVNLQILRRRLDARTSEDWGAGGAPEIARIAHWHAVGSDVPHGGIPIDATAPIEHVVDAILERVEHDR